MVVEVKNQNIAQLKLSIEGNRKIKCESQVTKIEKNIFNFLFSYYTNFWEYYILYSDDSVTFQSPMNDLRNVIFKIINKLIN